MPLFLWLTGEWLGSAALGWGLAGLAELQVVQTHFRLVWRSGLLVKEKLLWPMGAVTKPLFISLDLPTKCSAPEIGVGGAALL